ncbi:TPA: pantetheine-phosphate adenylyltransferase [Candidatus Latescibacteria bacterium]|nr:pantetheine-phosphate adenylyltransferase [Gemmatimonadota bacterium]HAA76322.1 pantetheine-phosphate adenylyltransferase [Candidatus Latescibacterota bacterium]
MSIALYPGTFDPMTYGHMDLATRALKIFDRVVVAIGINPAKNPIFSVEERTEMIQTVLNDDRFDVEAYEGLTVHYAQKRGIHTVIRSLRTLDEFESEIAMTTANRLMLPEFESIYLPPSQHYAHISSTLVRVIAEFGGDLSPFVPPHIESRLKQAFGNG